MNGHITKPDLEKKDSSTFADQEEVKFQALKSFS